MLGILKKIYLLGLVICVIAISGCGGDDVKKKDALKTSESESPDSMGDLNQKILDDPNNPDLYYQRAKAHKNAQEFTSAFNDIDRALAIDSLSSDYQTEYGALLYAVGRVGEAKFALEDAMKLDSENVSPKLIMAEIYFVLTNQDKAMTMINDALRIDDQLSKAYFLKGLIYKEQGNSSLSKSSFQTVTELDPDNIEAFNLLGMEYAQEGDSLALQYYRSALTIDSTNMDVLYNRAFYYQDQLKASEALWAYDELLHFHPNTAVAYYNKGFVQHGLMSEPEKAVDAFTEAIRINPEYYQAYNNRAVALEGLGRIDQAKADYKMALELKPNFDPAIKGLSRLISQ